jgi:hypothetical protein
MNTEAKLKTEEANAKAAEIKMKAEEANAKVAEAKLRHDQGDRVPVTLALRGVVDEFSLSQCRYVAGHRRL